MASPNGTVIPASSAMLALRGTVAAVTSDAATAVRRYVATPTSNGVVPAVRLIHADDQLRDQMDAVLLALHAEFSTVPGMSGAEQRHDYALGRFLGRHVSEVLGARLAVAELRGEDRRAALRDEVRMLRRVVEMVGESIAEYGE